MDFHPVLFNPRVSKLDKSQVKNKDVVAALGGNGELVAPRVPANSRAVHLHDGGHLLWGVFIPH